MALLWATLVKFELSAKSAQGQLKRLRRALDAPTGRGPARGSPRRCTRCSRLLLAAAPAVPNDVGGKYVAGAYVVFIVLLLVYVAIMAMKLARIERDLREVAEIAEAAPRTTRVAAAAERRRRLRGAPERS